MTKKSTPIPNADSVEKRQQAAAPAQSQQDPAEREAPPSNASVLVLAGLFLAAMFVVVAAEFVRHHI